MSTLNELLAQVGLTQYARSFASRHVDLDALRTLSDTALNEIGVAEEHRRLLRRAILDTDKRIVGPTPAKPRSDAPDRRQVSVLFCDLVGSTELSSRTDPEDLRDIIESYRQTCTRPIHHFGGFIQRFVGDGILALFGYPSAHENDAERAVRAALAVIEVMRGLDPAPGASCGELKVRIGIATGPVVVGDILEDLLAEKSAVIGDAPNLAARLQALAEPNTVVIDGETRRLAVEHFEYRSLGSVQLKGAGRPIRAFVPVGERSESRFEARGLMPAPLFGRQAEFNLLVELWHRAAAGAGQVALITGNAGIGKSRLIAALSEAAFIEASSQDVEVPFQIGLQCTQFHINTALSPFVRHLERLASIERGDSNTAKLAKLEKALGEVELALEARELLASTLDIDVKGVGSPLDLAPRVRRYRTLEAFESWYAALAARQPLLVVVEDIQWMDPTSLEMLGRLVDRARYSPMLIIASLRTSGDAAIDSGTSPGQRAAWLGEHHVTVCALTELNATDARQLLLATKTDHQLAPEVIETILAKGEGNPLYLEELTKGFIATNDAGAHSHTKLAAGLMAVPATISGLLLARLDQVGSAREVAQQAAVIGREFSLSLLKAITTLAENELHAAIDTLSKAELVRPVQSLSGTRYSFRHTLLQDSAYHSLLKRTRRLLHYKLAEHFERDEQRDAGVTEDVIAEHYARAGEQRKAAEKFKRAAEMASERSAQVEAANLFRKALDCVEGLGNTAEHQLLELEIAMRLAAALGSVRGYAASETEKHLSRAKTLCIALGEKAHHFTVDFGLFILRLVRGDLEEANELARGMSQETVDACLANGMVKMQMGHFESARALLEKAAGLSDPETDAPHLQTYALNPGIFSRFYLAHVLSFLGHSDDALALVERNLSIARRRATDSSHIYTYVTALAFAGRVHLLLTNATAVNDVSQELVRVSRRNHYGYFEAIGRIQQGWAIADMGSLSFGIKQMHDGLTALQQTGTGLAVPGACVQLAELYVRLGEKDSAVAALEGALAEDGRGSRIWNAEIARLQGEIELLQPSRNPDRAEECLRRAVEIARAQGARVLEQRAAVSWARLLQRQDRHPEAVSILDQVLNAPARGCNTNDLARARLLRDELVGIAKTGMQRESVARPR